MKPILPFKMHQNAPHEQWRAHTFWKKEPETIEWIKDFAPDSILWDIGANIGIYTLYAASLGHYVVAFEPQLLNWVALSNNVRLNKYEDRVEAIMCGIGRETGFQKFGTDRAATGTSGGQLGETGKLCYDLPVFSLNWISTAKSVQHIKIDVDGIEGEIVDGMSMILEHRMAESVLIELPKKGEERERIQLRFTGCGYTANNRYNDLPDHSRTKAWRVDADIENVVFTRLK